MEKIRGRGQGKRNVSPFEGLREITMSVVSQRKEQYFLYTHTHTHTYIYR